MKTVAVILVSVMLTACGTIGGAVSGAGQDLGKAGDWIRTRNYEKGTSTITNRSYDDSM